LELRNEAVDWCRRARMADNKLNVIAEILLFTLRGDMRMAGEQAAEELTELSVKTELKCPLTEAGPHQFLRIAQRQRCTASNGAAPLRVEPTCCWACYSSCLSQKHMGQVSAP